MGIFGLKTNHLATLFTDTDELFCASLFLLKNLQKTTTITTTAKTIFSGEKNPVEKLQKSPK
jgi:hypothetical protein